MSWIPVEGGETGDASRLLPEPRLRSTRLADAGSGMSGAGLELAEPRVVTIEVAPPPGSAKSSRERPSSSG